MSVIDPSYGVTLTIDGVVVSDEAIVIPLGDTLSAYVYDPDAVRRDEDGQPLLDERDRIITREPGNELVARLSSVTSEKDGSITGVDEATGLGSRWFVAPGRRCRGC